MVLIDTIIATVIINLIVAVAILGLFPICYSCMLLKSKAVFIVSTCNCVMVVSELACNFNLHTDHLLYGTNHFFTTQVKGHDLSFGID